MDYEAEILGALLNKFEKSKAFETGTFTRKITVKPAENASLSKRLDDPDEKRLFLSVLSELKKNGLADFSWEKYEEGNLVKQIWLIPEERAVAGCRERLGRADPGLLAGKLEAMLLDSIAGLRRDGYGETGSSALSDYLERTADALRETKRIRAPFSADMQLNEDLLKALLFMEKNRGEQLERVMSTALYGDSKRFEKAVRQKAVQVLRTLKKEEAGEEDDFSKAGEGGFPLSEGELLLQEKGIVRWPEVMEFCGRIRVCLAESPGAVADYSAERYGAYINSETVRRAASVRPAFPGAVRRVLWIENKANYVWYIANERKDDELVLYHGGFYSPVKGLWFRKVREGLLTAADAPGGSAAVEGPAEPGGPAALPEFLHWSDIDLGGFRIFHRLKKELVPELKPFRMDLETLEKYRAETMRIENSSYLDALRGLLEDPEYSPFRDVIALMLGEGIRLEQEVLIR